MYKPRRSTSRVTTYGYGLLGWLAGAVLTQLLLDMSRHRETDWLRIVCLGVPIGMAVSAHYVLISDWLTERQKKRTSTKQTKP